MERQKKRHTTILESNMFKKTKSLKTFFILSAISLGMTQTVVAHEYIYSPDTAQRSEINIPTLKADIDAIPYSSLLYGFQLELELDNATFNTSNVNAIRNATTFSIPNVFRPYRATDNMARYRISGEQDLRAVNSIDISIDKSVLSVPYNLSITIPVTQDIMPPDAPHEEANRIASLATVSTNATDFLNGSGTVFTLKLNKGEFLPGCTDPIAKSIMKTSNIQGIVRIWRKTENQVEFIVEGGNYRPNTGNWNFELGEDTTTLKQTLYVSSPINY